MKVRLLSISIFLVLLQISMASGVVTDKPYWPFKNDQTSAMHDFPENSAFVLVHLNSGKRVQIGGARTRLRLAPCSTYKIPHALIGLETGILSGPDHSFPYDGKKRMLEVWERDHSLRTAMAYSVVPIFKDLAVKIGSEQMLKWLKTLEYGNCDISSGLTSFWLGESLKISVEEQINFLTRLLEKKLPVSEKTIAAINEITLLEKTENDEYHGKTGSSYKNGKWLLGWWIGWLNRGEDRYLFAANIEGSGYHGAITRKFVEKALKQIGLLRETHEEKLNLNFENFDQNFEMGWRKISEKTGHTQAIKLIEEYLSRHRKNLEKWQTTILHFHAGQMLAFAGQRQEAIKHFRQSYNSLEVEKTSPIRWNAYVRATIAFLQNDSETMKSCREAMNKGPQDPKWVSPNQKVVDRLISGANRLSYLEAYSGTN